MQYNPKVYLIERIIASASYLTLGFAGFIWLIVAALLKKRVTPFIMYHILQSIFLSMAYYLFIMIAAFPFVQYIFSIIYKIPLINLIPYYINMPLQLFFGFSFLQIIKVSIIAYFSLTSFMGYYTYVPYVSDIIKGKSDI